MKLTIYQVDAFSDKVFQGNPAAVCPLTEWLADDVMLKIAAENNLAETAFYVPKEDSFEIRWFTPNTEVDLCGHATLATAYVIRHCENCQKDVINFYSPRSGKLPVIIQQDKFVMNFPSDQFTETPLTDELLTATNKKPVAAFKGKTDYMLVFEKQEDITTLQPNLPQIANISKGNYRNRKRRKLRFCIPIFCTGSWCKRRCRLRLCTHHTYTLLGRAIRQN
jgi:PhzF family phenazine biosynthesis protein